jgi:hypothetical protein
VANEPDNLLKRVLDEVLDGRRALSEGIDGVRNRLESFRDETLTNFDGVFLRLENVESEVLNVRIATLEKRLADLDGDSAEPH